MDFPLHIPATAAAPLEPTDPPQLGPYRLTGRLGQGGQAVVYLGEAEFGGPVAVKFFLAPLGERASDREDALRELEAAKQVARFCTAQVLDSGMLGTRPYIVSEYVPGPSLQQVVTSTGPYSGSVLDRLAIGTATALLALHQARIVHRDFKPGNVLIGPDGPRVIDFGIARVVTGDHALTSQVMGTPAYMAPEQLTPGALGPATDVFSWASSMVFAATGRPPFGNESAPVVMNRIAHLPPELDGVDEPLRALLIECLAKDPAIRPTAQQVLDRLVRRRERTPSEAVSPSATTAPVGAAPVGAGPIGAGSVGAAPVGAGSPATRGARSRRGVWLIAAGLASLLAALGAAALWLLPGGTAKQSPSGPKAPQSSVAAGFPVQPNEQGENSQAGVATATTTGPATSATPGSSQGRAPGQNAGSGVRTKPPTVAPTPRHRVELGPGHFTEYCQKLGWEWEEYRESPQPGAYCVMRKGQTMYLTQDQLDAGCQWRYSDPLARHYFKGKSNYCYAYR